MKREKEHVLVLVHLDENNVDVSGNEFSKSGFVRSEIFTHDKDI